MTNGAGGGGRGRTWRLVGGAAILALVAGVVGGVIGAFIRPAPQSTPSAAAGTCDVSSVAAHVLPSIVTINVAGSGGNGTGSGSVLDRQGNILTNDHVIAAAATRGNITVDFARGQSGVPATIVGRDPSTDLAVIRIQRSVGSLTPIQFGNSADLAVGQQVVAAGSPLGLSSTITSGIVSALSRYVNVGQGDQPALLVNAIQTDAAINPGNSGGPLTDCSGLDVGVNSAGAQVPSAGGGGGGSIGLNFAIPIDFARSVANQMIQTGKVTHPTIGVLGVTVTDEIARATGEPRGALVEQVVPSLGAAAAGIRPGDVITRVGKTDVNSVDQMLVALREQQIGSSVDVTYARNGSRHTARATVSGA
ncbi:MAG: trypsin-like peptidase domain-containing protein [Candidatus Dormibacteraeota bacterium]|nr:trypsin-like peptidase domain-containing protein [Candidatus Dormibacteraeota bacterium]